MSGQTGSGRDFPRGDPRAYRARVRLRVLGPVEASGESGPVTLGGPKQRLVLAHLLLGANRIIPAEALIDAVWGEEPPEAARGTLQAYVSRLRSALGAERIEGRPPGYTLRADPEEIDALRFEALIHEARRTLPLDPRAAADLLLRPRSCGEGRPWPT